MRYAIISDIHSNIQALERSLDIIYDEVDEICCLGDIVGYNANPQECLQLIKNKKKIKHIIQGNHDYASANLGNMRFSQIIKWSDDAWEGIRYSHDKLINSQKKWLNNLPLIKIIEDPLIPFIISHESLKRDWNEGYIMSDYDAEIALNRFKDKDIFPINVCFFGHTHVPTYCKGYFKNNKFKVDFDIGKHLRKDIYVIEENDIYMINPGAIGQPRNNGVTSYVLFDTDERTIKIEDFEYDYKDAQEAIINAKLNSRIANRLKPQKTKKNAKGVWD